MANKTFSKLLQNYVNKDFEQLLLLANEALGIIAVAYKRVKPEGGATANFILPFIATAVVVDGQYTELEHKFVNSLLESSLTYEEGTACMNTYAGTEVIDLVGQMIDVCGESVKKALVQFCLCFVAVDETISHEESEYIAKLLA